MGEGEGLPPLYSLEDSCRRSAKPLAHAHRVRMPTERSLLGANKMALGARRRAIHGSIMLVTSQKDNPQLVDLIPCLCCCCIQC